jgi:hypothetical protein
LPEIDPCFARDNLIRILDNEKAIEPFFTCKSGPTYVQQWVKKFATYTRDLLSLARSFGNFWHYHLQLSLSKSDAKLTDPELPDIDWQVPRWLVTEWQFTKTTSEDSVVLSDPTPYFWKPLQFPSSGYPDPQEAAFLHKLGIRDEQLRQARDLKEIVQSENAERWLKGRFQSVDKKKRTHDVEVFLVMELQVAHAGVQMPQPGTRVHLEVDHNWSAKLWKKNMARLEDVVVYDALETAASFKRVVNVQGKDLHMASNVSEYTMLVTYPLDATPQKPT